MKDEVVRMESQLICTPKVEILEEQAERRHTKDSSVWLPCNHGALASSVGRSETDREEGRRLLNITREVISSEGGLTFFQFPFSCEGSLRVWAGHLF